MSLSSIIGTAATGIAAINRQLSVVSQNVANAGTPGYARETVALDALTAGGAGFGVVAAPAVRETDDALQAALGQQNASVAGQQVRSDALAGVDAAQGATGAGNDLASRLGALSNAFTALMPIPPTRRSKLPW